jgi:hypothetical protein
MDRAVQAAGPSPDPFVGAAAARVLERVDW